MLRAYFVYLNNPRYGIAVISDSKVKAKKIALADMLQKKQDGLFVDPVLYEQTNFKTHTWIISNADISGLNLGIAQVSKDTLLRGIYFHIGLQTCDICGETATLYRDPQLFEGKCLNAVCSRCYLERKEVV